MRYLIYALLNPTTDMPFYIGWTDTKQKGIKRPFEHFNEERRQGEKITSGNRLKLNTIRKMRKNDIEPSVEEIYYTDDFDHSLDIEKMFISHWGRRDKNEGILTNLTDGGQGTVGVKDSLETRRKKSIGRIGKKHTEYSKQLIKEKRKLQSPTIYSDETRKQMSKNAWMRNNKGKTYEEMYGINKANEKKKNQSDYLRLYRANEENEEKRKLAHRLTWIKKMKNVYIDIFRLLDDGIKQYIIVDMLNVSVDTVRKARLNRADIEHDINIITIEG